MFYVLSRVKRRSPWLNEIENHALHSKLQALRALGAGMQTGSFITV